MGRKTEDPWQILSCDFATVFECDTLVVKQCRRFPVIDLALNLVIHTQEDLDRLCRAVQTALVALHEPSPTEYFWLSAVDHFAVSPRMMDLYQQQLKRWTEDRCRGLVRYGDSYQRVTLTAESLRVGIPSSHARTREEALRLVLMKVTAPEQAAQAWPVASPLSTS